MTEYMEELLGVYAHPLGSRGTSSWLRMVATSDYSDADIVSLVAERDDLREEVVDYSKRMYDLQLSRRLERIEELNPYKTRMLDAGIPEGEFGVMLEKLIEQRDEARKVAVTAFNNMGYFNWQTWTLHYDEIHDYMHRLKDTVIKWELDIEHKDKQDGKDNT